MGQKNEVAKLLEQAESLKKNGQNGMADLAIESAKITANTKATAKATKEHLDGK